VGSYANLLYPCYSYNSCAAEIPDGEEATTRLPKPGIVPDKIYLTDTRNGPQPHERLDYSHSEEQPDQTNLLSVVRQARAEAGILESRDR